MNHFWKWDVSTINDKADPEAPAQEERTLLLNGTIAEESWFDDEVTPQAFKDELNAGTGDITVWINSPGGDCFAAASIYNMLMDYKGKVTVKIDGLAASAASVIAMAGDKVIVTPVSMIMIHNPMTMAAGDKADMEKAIDMLESVKDSIINAYSSKTGLSRNKLSKLMDEETWMDAGKAVELGFADEIMKRPQLDEGSGNNNTIANGINNKVTDVAVVPYVSENGCLYSSRKMAETFTNKVTAYILQHQDRPPIHDKVQDDSDYSINTEPPASFSSDNQSKYSIKALEQRLLFMKSLIGAASTGRKKDDDSGTDYKKSEGMGSCESIS